MRGLNLFGIIALSALLLAALLGLAVLAQGAEPALRPVVEAAPTSTAALPQVVRGLPPILPEGAAESGQSLQHGIFEGRVLDQAGRPLAGAGVSAGGYAVTSNADGSFQLPATGLAQWVSVAHVGHLPVVLAAQPGVPLVARLSPDDGETISLLFGGDVMFGRRFYDPNEDGVPDDGLLVLGAGASEHLALLAGVQPLLESADLTAVNLEGALAADPYIDPTRLRPSRLHPSKEYVFLTDTSAAVALRRAGVDVVDLGNNHLYDALDAGVVDTVQALALAGFEPGSGFFGAGLSEAEAWAPAVVQVRGQTVAFLGCTTITYPFVDGQARRNEVSYFASDAEEKGGAARCSEDRIRSEIAAAAANNDLVVFMIHGGVEYDPVPSDVVRRLTAAAREAGATLVINHHPHVVGGLDWNGDSLAAWTLGNLVSDQTLWQTFQTYLLTVYVRRGEVVRVHAQPLLLEGFVPRGVTGALATSFARDLAGWSPGMAVVESGAVELDLSREAIPRYEAISVDGGGDPGTIFHLPGSWWVADATAPGGVRLGRDWLWGTGSFEDEDVDDQVQEGAGWDLDGANKALGHEYGYEGNGGVRLQRGALDRDDVVLSPLHRIPVRAGTDLTVAGMVRGLEGADLTLQLGWFPDTRGPSATRTRVPIVLQAGGEWQAFQVDAIAPPGTVAVGLFLRLAPPAEGLARVHVDDLRLIEWAPAGSGFSPRYDYVRVAGPARLQMRFDLLPGGEESRAEVAAIGKPIPTVGRPR